MPTDSQYGDERQMFQQIAEGNEAAFERIYRLYVPQLAAFLRRFSLSDREADEVVQETFLRIWLQRDKLVAVDYPKAWVFRIASNIIYNYLKRVVKEAQVLNTVGALAKQEHNDTEETFYLHQLTQAIAHAVNQLSPQRKRVYELSRQEGMTIPEIADNLGISNNTAKNTLISSLQFIRDFLNQKGFDISYFLLVTLSVPICYCLPVNIPF